MQYFRACPPHGRPLRNAATNRSRSTIAVPPRALTPRAKSGSGRHPPPGPTSTIRGAAGGQHRIEGVVEHQRGGREHLVAGREHPMVERDRETVLRARERRVELDHHQRRAARQDAPGERREPADHADALARLRRERPDRIGRRLGDVAGAAKQVLRERVDRGQSERPAGRVGAAVLPGQREGRHAFERIRQADVVQRDAAVEQRVGQADRAVGELDSAELTILAAAGECRRLVQRRHRRRRRARERTFDRGDQVVGEGGRAAGVQGGAKEGAADRAPGVARAARRSAQCSAAPIGGRRGGSFRFRACGYDRRIGGAA
jgi:hypothetical protein